MEEMKPSKDSCDLLRGARLSTKEEKQQPTGRNKFSSFQVMAWVCK